MKNIIIIQNTDYHFEVTISVYQTVKNIGYKPYIYKIEKDKFKQDEFCEYYNIIYADDKIIDDAVCGIVISAYPNPYVSKNNSIPNYHNNIFKTLNNRLIYISHRFKNKEDYIDSEINKNNTVCLSPLSEKINMDYINIVTNPIEPHNTFIADKCRITIQANFDLYNRAYQTIKDIIKYAPIYNYQVNILGTYSFKHFYNVLNDNVQLFDHITELKFYDILNNHTDWIFAGIDETVKDGTYLYERYSTNFNQAFISEKPIICNNIFEHIYHVPGVYYTNNILETIQYIKAFSIENYNNIINKFKPIKNNLFIHTKNILQKKIDYVCNI